LKLKIHSPLETHFVVFLKAYKKVKRRRNKRYESQQIIRNFLISRATVHQNCI